ncbi:uncharacterized protein LOC143146976 isoform X2 [Ptiloglossa arizonensis]|uniref:uncharacterized protein LOC143146976 isoform X2 n=1 Tax=Ptiloglossa arizonensis TaxID=3350558 RepID=UPI003FA0D754
MRSFHMFTDAARPPCPTPLRNVDTALGCWSSNRDRGVDNNYCTRAWIHGSSSRTGLRDSLVTGSLGGRRWDFIRRDGYSIMESRFVPRVFENSKFTYWNVHNDWRTSKRGVQILVTRRDRSERCSTEAAKRTRIDKKTHESAKQNMFVYKGPLYGLEQKKRFGSTTKCVTSVPRGKIEEKHVECGESRAKERVETLEIGKREFFMDWIRTVEMKSRTIGIKRRGKTTKLNVSRRPGKHRARLTKFVQLTD